MKIAILGTRGIPNHYGGFEQFAEYLSIGLVEKGHDVTVYNSSSHPFKDPIFKGVKIRHIYDPENRIGTAGQFIYDFLCILDTRKNDYDIILQLGYTSSSIFFDFHPKGSLVITNMDGLEWKRTKYSAKVQRFLLWAESRAVKKSHHLISDSIGIQKYLISKYDVASTYIPYGSDAIEVFDESFCQTYHVQKYNYNLLIARLEPENSIETILDGVVKANTDTPFLVIGNHQTKHGTYLKERFKEKHHIRFLGGIYDKTVLDSLRYFSNLYFHGHTVGGTNPSLLEAMGSQALICAHNNLFNSTILGNDALYFSSSDDVAKVMNTVQKKSFSDQVAHNLTKIHDVYSWNNIIDAYESLFITTHLEMNRLS